ncbi:MAG TPA: DUF5995 family protein [Acidimicrobiales bacterium]|nr:DUF5995 family protein [Acidimicrobiales bacterium]
MGIAETAEELRAIALASDDASGYFPALYARVTSRVAAAGFAEDLAVVFASYYTRAFHRQIERPRCWQATWDVAGDRRLLIVQHLLLGINAHVNHDLPLAVVDVARRRGGLAPLRPEFDAVNDVLADTYHEVLRDLDGVARWTSEAATLGGGRLFNFSLRVARAQAWDAAVRLFPLDDRGAAAYRAELDQLVSVLAYLVTRPALPARLVVTVLRRFEQREPRRVTQALLGGS